MLKKLSLQVIPKCQPAWRRRNTRSPGQKPALSLHRCTKSEVWGATNTTTIFFTSSMVSVEQNRPNLLIYHKDLLRFPCSTRIFCLVWLTAVLQATLHPNRLCFERKQEDCKHTNIWVTGASPRWHRTQVRNCYECSKLLAFLACVEKSSYHFSPQWKTPHIILLPEIGSSGVSYAKMLLFLCQNQFLWLSFFQMAVKSQCSHTSLKQPIMGKRPLTFESRWLLYTSKSKWTLG